MFEFCQLLKFVLDFFFIFPIHLSISFISAVEVLYVVSIISQAGRIYSRA